MMKKFPALPAVYSSDMQKMVRWLMIAEPSQRPDVDAVRTTHPCAAGDPRPSPSARARGQRARLRGAPSAPRGAGGADQPGSAVTLGTIKVPKNLKMLKKRLPAPSYPSDHEKAAKERAAAASRGEGQRLAQARSALARRRRRTKTTTGKDTKEPRNQMWLS